MGLPGSGTTLSWEKTKKYTEHVRKRGVMQFIKLYNSQKGRKNDPLLFGDELEYTLIKFNHVKGEAKLNLASEFYLKRLAQLKEDCANWMPEFATYMVEGVPGKPFDDLIAVEPNMKKRREIILNVLKSQEDETCLTISVFPRLGCQSFTTPTYPATTIGSSKSLFFPDEVITHKNPRYTNMAATVFKRRGEPPAINIPVFRDINTPNPFNGNSNPFSSSNSDIVDAMLPDHIYMNAPGFGFGCSCLQVTFQASDIDEARCLYDQLTPLAPVLMALGAASPVVGGHLSDLDHRWAILSEALDDRTMAERGCGKLIEGEIPITTSKYGSLGVYLSPQGQQYNDLERPLNNDAYDTLVKQGIDDQLAKHVAHLCIRDCYHLTSENLNSDDTELEHLENILSWSWPVLRFKPPPSLESSMGWRVEFRPMDCQLTDFENAAFTVFIILVTQTVLFHNLNLLIPLSKVEENIQRAQKRGAVLNEKFHFCSSPNGSRNSDDYANRVEPSSTMQELSINEIINGDGNGNPGIIYYIRDYMKTSDMHEDTLIKMEDYLSFISLRASGALMTTAAAMRDFIHSHADYKFDSVVSEEIQYDLLKLCHQISKGENMFQSRSLSTVS